MSRWLLLLGSNEGSDQRVRDALASLQALGDVACLGIHHLRPRSGAGAWYFNALAVLDSALADAALKPALRDIELRLGRDRSTPEQVAIDIDVLARDHGGWRADPHALAKCDLTQWPVTQLLAEAQLQVRLPD